MILASVLFSAATVTVTGCAAPADQGHDGDSHVDRVAQPIIRGTTDGTDHDSVVVLTTFQAGQRMALCTATLVAPNLIITARHCVSNTDGATVCAEDGTPVTGGNISGTRVANSLVVFTGKDGAAPDSTVEANAAAHGKRVIVDAATNLCNHDLAFVVLDKDVAAPIAAIRMAPPSASETVSAVGWGVDESGNLPTHREVRSSLPLVGLGPALYPDNPSWGYGDREFMVGESACAGDSGSPAFAKSGAIVGIAARTGNGQQSDGNYATTCVGDGAHSVYTHLGNFTNLINAAFKEAGHDVKLEAVQSASAGGAEGASSGSGGSSGSSGKAGGRDDQAPVVKDSANVNLLGGGDPAAPAAGDDDDGGTGGCSMASGETPHDNVAYAAGLVAFVALLLGLRRRFRRVDDKELEPPPAREPYESMML
jgi:MYXO-CTERM domain-containing protein